MDSLKEKYSSFSFSHTVAAYTIFFTPSSQMAVTFVHMYAMVT
jgi:hypothetical protein